MDDMVGNLLSAERRKKKLEIADVEQNTGIRSSFLVAIEEGRYNALPGEVYVKGFIRNYGNYLGLNGSQLVSLYTDSLREIEAAAAPTTVARLNAARSKKFSKWPLISSVIVIFILVISVWSLYSWKHSSPGNFQQLNNGSNSKPQLQPALVPAGTKAPTKLVYPGAANKPVVLTASFSDRCWASVIADGKSVYEGTPKIGEFFTWEAERQIIVNFGNAAAVDLTFNGQPIGKAGEQGEVVVKTFTAPEVKP